MSARDQVITWLRSAHATEKSVEQNLEQHIKGTERYPELRQRLQSHLQETRRHMEKVERCLDSLGEKPSGAKEAMSNLMGNMKGLGEKMFEDELVKNALSDYATEHFEIACYKSLAAGATHAGMPEVARVAEEILREEEAMAHWLEEIIPSLTNGFLDEEQRKSA
jgi:ferritin-like metal-binding protein YciE